MCGSRCCTWSSSVCGIGSAFNLAVLTAACTCFRGVLISRRESHEQCGSAQVLLSCYTVLQVTGDVMLHYRSKLLCSWLSGKAIMWFFQVAAYAISEVYDHPSLANGEALVVSSCAWHWKAISPCDIDNTMFVFQRLNMVSQALASGRESHQQFGSTQSPSLQTSLTGSLGTLSCKLWWQILHLVAGCVWNWKCT